MAAGQDGERATPGAARSFAIDGYVGEIAVAVEAGRLASEVERLIDPAAALETIHWGRNYLYTARLGTTDGPLEVVVKQFRNQGLRRRLERRLKGSKATRSWRVALALRAAGLLTPEPVLLVESTRGDGPSFFVTRRLAGVFEVRHFFRRLAGDPTAGEFPEVAPERLLADLGSVARRLHDAGIFYRDLSIGNVLAQPAAGDTLELWLVDPNRAQVGLRLGLLRRCRDLSRFPIVERAQCAAFLAGYWGQVPPRSSPRWWLWALLVRGYLLKHALKNRLRGRGGRPRLAKGGRHHAHIPPATEGAAARDRVVWDRLSDQPHQHAGRLAKLAIRAADAGSHLRDAAIVAGAAPAIWRRYRALSAGLYAAPATFRGIGVGVRPWPGELETQVAILSDLGVRSVLLRLHPWEDDHRDEEALARALAGQGVELSFALPQNRDLVKDRARWRAAVTELGAGFSPYGRVFQVGQAPNRSKWGIWTRGEYVALYLEASEILRRHPGVEVIGPAVIDFELQVTAAILNRRLPGLAFDAVSSLLYVDRRGAPESRQLGLDTVGKVVLLRAIAETARSSSDRCWITEVNWPLWEGPHAPAGRKVSVDEETQADYLARYYLLALGTGLVEKVFWWRLLARGYGLLAPQEEGYPRRRPSFRALKTLIARLEGATFHGPLTAPPGAFLYRFSKAGVEQVVAWSLSAGVAADLPRPAVEAVSRDGNLLEPPSSTRVELGPSPTYYRLGD